MGSELQRALSGADLVIGVLPTGRQSNWVLFELGRFATIEFLTAAIDNEHSAPRHLRAYDAQAPDAPSPATILNAGDVTLVAACASALDGDRGVKMLALRDAMGGVFLEN